MRPKTLTRVDLYDAVHRRTKLSRTECAALTELILEEISDCISRGETVKLSGFGTFSVRKKNSRIGRNPKTGVEVPIEPRRVLVFKASPIVKTQVNLKQAVGSKPVEVRFED